MSRNRRTAVEAHTLLGGAMPATEEITIVVRTEIADGIRKAVSSGRYPNEGAFIEETVEEFWATDLSDEILEREVLPVYDEMEANPGSALSLAEVRKRLAETHSRYVHTRKS
jgi:antitoxin ParD1/3/4